MRTAIIPARTIVLILAILMMAIIIAKSIQILIAVMRVSESVRDFNSTSLKVPAPPPPRV